MSTPAENLFQTTEQYLGDCRDILGYDDVSELSPDEARAALRLIEMCSAIRFLDGELHLREKLQEIAHS